MRPILLATLMIASTASQLSLADDTINYNLINLQAEASRQVNNDEMHVVLFVEKSNKQPSELATQINLLMNQATTTARQFPQVKVETGAQSTYPIYDNDTNKLKEWRSRAEVRLESKDFKATSQLMSQLQQNFQTQSVNFTVSNEQLKKVENELMVEASKNFQQRAQLISQAWNKGGAYTLVNLNLNTNNNYNPQPIMMRASFAKVASADSIPSQEMASGQSRVTVNANGSIQLK